MVGDYASTLQSNGIKILRSLYYAPVLLHYALTKNRTNSEVRTTLEPSEIRAKPVNNVFVRNLSYRHH